MVDVVNIILFLYNSLVYKLKALNEIVLDLISTLIGKSFCWSQRKSKLSLLKVLIQYLDEGNILDIILEYYTDDVWFIIFVSVQIFNLFSIF